MDKLLIAPSSVGIGTIRHESTRQENAGPISRLNEGVFTVVGRGEEGPLCDPGSELLLVRGREIFCAREYMGRERREKDT